MPDPQNPAAQPCLHENFFANCSIHRLAPSDGDHTVIGYSMEIEACCHDCKMPFRFLVPDCGMIPGKAATSVNGEKLNVYIEPSDGSLMPNAGLLGYRLTQPSDASNVPQN